MTARVSQGGRGRRGRLAGLTVTAVLLAGAGLAPASAGAVVAGAARPAVLAPARPAVLAPARTPPHVRLPAAAAQCAIGLGAPTTTDAQKAAAVLGGRVDLGRYGWFRLGDNPSWQPVSTLDSAGNGHMHSLHWALPLLREGVRTSDEAMLTRFYGLLRDWVHDNPPGGPTRRLAWGPPIYEGYRAQVLVCAAAAPDRRADAAWLRSALVTHGRLLADPGRYEGRNNASLHQSMGLLAIGRSLRRSDWMGTATTRIGALATRLVGRDGSDGEGSPEYALDNYQWFGQARARLQAAGVPVPASLRRTGAVPAFLAQATRPDFRLENLGDASLRTLPRAVLAGTAAEYSATAGASGAPPASRFAAYPDGGYVFARSSWAAGRDATWYSVRAGSRAGRPHAHDDATALTVYAGGVSLLADVGQWSYRYGATRDWVVSHAAHNVVVVDAVPRSSGRPPTLVTARQGEPGGVDVVTVRDPGYAGITLARTFVYDRAHDYFVVWDRLAATRPRRAAQQWGFTPARAAQVTGDTVTVTPDAGDGTAATLLFAGGGATLGVTTGGTAPRRGWFSPSYATLTPAPSVRATRAAATHADWVTVIVPVRQGGAAGAVGATAVRDGPAVLVGVTAADGSTSWLRVTPTAALRRGPSTRPAPQLEASARAVRPGRSVRLWLRGLPPAGAAVVESAPAGDPARWAPLREVQAGGAGTASLLVTVREPVAFRVRLAAIDGVSSGEQVSAALAVQVLPTAPAPTAPPAAPGGGSAAAPAVR